MADRSPGNLYPPLPRACSIQPSLQNPIISQLLLLTAIDLFLGCTMPNVSNTAQICGLAGGLIYGWLMAPTVYSQKKLVASRPVAVAFGLEAILLIAWYLYFA